MTDSATRGLPARYRRATSPIAAGVTARNRWTSVADQPRIAAEDVVGIESIGHAAEPADVLQGEEEAGEPHVLHPPQLVVADLRRLAMAASSASTRSRACSIDRDGRKRHDDAERTRPARGPTGRR